MDDAFENKPFARLGKLVSPATNAPPHEDEKLFLAAVEKLRPASGEKVRGFSLSTICPLWGVGPKMTRKRKSRTPVSTVPKAAPPSPPPPEADQGTSADEFFEAMRTVRPLARGGREIARKVRPNPVFAANDSGFAESVEKSLEFALYASDEYIEGHVVGLDELVFNRLKAGQFSPEAHLDLHGLNAQQAWEALREFMRQAWFKGLRCVLLVPGRGLNSPLGQPVLRGRLPQWLTQEPFRRVVLAFCTARPHDGGAGGIYALLRRSRKKGRIQWERLPADSDLYRF